MDGVDQVTWNFMASRDQLPAIQAVVMRHDLRFANQIPATGDDRVMVRISNHHAGSPAWHQAQEAINAILHAPVMVPPTRWQRFRAWVGGFGPRTA